MRIIRVVIADDHPVMRTGIHGLLEKVADIQVVGEASTGQQALQLVKDVQPDVLLLDMEFPDMKGTEVAQKLRERNSQVKILAISAYEDSVFVHEVLKLGASGYLVKDEAPQMIIEAVRGVADGEEGWISRRIVAKVISVEFGDERKGLNLTQREMEVIQQVVLGKRNNAIAATLKISPKTIEKYLESIFAKLGVESRTEAAVYAVREGWVKEEASVG